MGRITIGVHVVLPATQFELFQRLPFKNNEKIAKFFDANFEPWSFDHRLDALYLYLDSNVNMTNGTQMGTSIINV